MNSNTMSIEEYEICECCGERGAQLAMERIPFIYGVGEKAVELYADMPVWSCESCGEIYSGSDGEEAEREAICKHLGRLTPHQIVAARKSLGQTQVEFAQGAGVSRVSLARWESGAQIPSRVFDARIREYLRECELKRAVQKYGEPKFRTDVMGRREAANAFRLMAA